MTSTTEVTTDGFFDGVGGGGAPSAKLSDVNDGVVGEIVDQRIIDVRPFGGKEGEVEYNRDGSVKKQLVVTVQTALTNWAGVAKIPVVDRDDRNSPQKPGSEDDGKRAVYLPQWSNIQSAVADAVRKTNGGKNGPLANGAKFGVKVTELKDTGKGNPLKIHAAFYEAPAASADFFPSTPQAAPAAAPAQDPWSGAATSAAPAPATAQQVDEPPF